MLVAAALSMVLAGSFVAGDYCSADDRARSWTLAAKQRTRDRVRAACERVGGSRTYCEYWDAVVRRESSGVSSRVHTRGIDVDGVPEYGLGPLGLSVRWHADKFPGADADPAFCTPEAAFVVAHSIAVRAVEVYHADDAVEIQAIFGGGLEHRQCERVGVPAWAWRHPLLGRVARLFGLGRERVWCRTTPSSRTVRSVCSRMAGCRDKLSRADLGEAVPPAERAAWAIEAARAFGG